MGRLEHVEPGHVMPAFGKNAHQRLPQMPRAAADENPHELRIIRAA